MPIDRAMSVELAAEWLPLFVAAETLTASHPLRVSAFEEAELAVYDSYLAQAEATAESGNLNDAYQDIAADVIEVLRGVAVLLTAQPDRSE